MDELPDDLDVRSLHLRVVEQIPGLSKYAASLGLQPADAEDATQAAMEALLAQYAKGRASNIDDVNGFMFRTVRNQAANCYRHASAQHRLVDQLKWFVRTTGGDDAEGLALDDLVLGLPPDLGAAFVLVKMLQFTQTEASSILGCSQGEVSKRVEKARAALDELLRRVQDG